MLTTAQGSRLGQAEAEAFLFHQAESIDTRDFASWIDCFVPEATYWIPARIDYTDPKAQPSFMYDDFPTMVARCERLLDQGTGGQQPSTRSSHIVSNVRIVDASKENEAVVRSRFHVTQFRRDVLRFYAGSFTHHLVSTAAGWKIRFQRVDLIDCDGIHDAILQVYL
jgi:benzoate/toluate 1,2-dioxygenase beta subunit